MPTKYINLTCLHGIAVDPIKQKTYASRWEQYINLSMPNKDVQVRCIGMQWDSCGDSMKDLANVVSSKQFRDDQVGHLIEQVEDHLPMTSVFLAHSLGCSWMMAALNHLKPHQPTLVGIGGPMGHPLWGRILKSVGLFWETPPVNLKPIAFWNADDGVSSFGNWYSAPQGWQSHRIEVFPQRVGGFKEHADQDYLTHPNLIKYLTE